MTTTLVATASPDDHHYETLPRNRVLIGDAVATLKRLPTASVDCVVSSPPYHLLRNYAAGPDELGQEPTVDEYVARLVAVFDELARVLKPWGVAWLNIGDGFSRGDRYGAPAKSLLLAPERLLLALSQRGWSLRSRVVWAKTNPQPQSARDRLSCTWEPLFQLTRSPKYFFDLDRIRAPHTSKRTPARVRELNSYERTRPSWAGRLAGFNDGLARNRLNGVPGNPLGKNPGDVWTMSTAGFRGTHFAVFPEQLIVPPILTTGPERTCLGCGRPWLRPPGQPNNPLRPSCGCEAGYRPGVVLDPFMGAGTVGMVAQRLGRDWLGIELNAEFAALAEARIASAEGRQQADHGSKQRGRRHGHAEDAETEQAARQGELQATDQLPRAGRAHQPHVVTEHAAEERRGSNEHHRRRREDQGLKMITPEGSGVADDRRVGGQPDGRHHRRAPGGDWRRRVPHRPDVRRTGGSCGQPRAGPTGQ